MTEIISGHFFYGVRFPGRKVCLVEYRENAPAAAGTPWRANSIYEPAIFYKDWFNLRLDGREHVADSLDSPFMEITAVFPWPFVAAGSECGILFTSVKPAKKTVHVELAGRLFDVLDLDLPAGRTWTVVPFRPTRPGTFLFKLRSAVSETVLLRLTALDPVSGGAEDPAFDPQSFEAEVTERFEEELYFSLKDVFDAKTLASIDFDRLFPDNRRGLSRLLNTLKFMPLKEEVRLVEDLLQKDFEFGRELLENSFPFDLVFLLPKDLFGEIVLDLGLPLVARLLPLLDKPRGSALLAALPEADRLRASTLRGRREASPEAVSQAAIDALKASVASVSRARLQEKFGTIIRTRKSVQTVYERKTRPAKKRAAARSFRILSSRSPAESEFLAIRGADADSVYYEALTEMARVQIVADHMGLSRETVSDFRDLRPGQVFGLPRDSNRLRIKAAAWIGDRMEEQLIDCLVLRPVNIGLKWSASAKGVTAACDPSGIAVPGHQRDAALHLCAAHLTDSGLCSTTEHRVLDASHGSAAFDASDLPATAVLSLDLSEGVFRFDTFRNAVSGAAPALFAAAAPAVRTLTVTPGAENSGAQEILGSLFETWRLRAEDSLLGLSFFAELNLRLSALGRGKRHLEFGRAELGRLYSMLLPEPMVLPEERLALYFNLRSHLSIPEKAQLPEMMKLSAFLLPKLSRTEASLTELIRNLAALPTGSDPGRERKLHARLRRDVFKTKKRTEIIQSLVLLGLREPAFVRRMLPRFLGPQVQLAGPETLADLFPLLDLLALAGIPCGLSASG